MRAAFFCLQGCTCLRSQAGSETGGIPSVLSLPLAGTMGPPLKSLRRSNPFSIPEGSGTCDEINKNNNNHHHQDSEERAPRVTSGERVAHPFLQLRSPFSRNVLRGEGRKEGRKEEEVRKGWLPASPVIACQLLESGVIKLILGGWWTTQGRTVGRPVFPLFPGNFPGGF